MINRQSLLVVVQWHCYGCLPVSLLFPVLLPQLRLHLPSANYQVGSVGHKISIKIALEQSVAKASSADYLQTRYINFDSFNSVSDGLTALANHEIDAFVYDQPLLQYLAKTQYQGQVDVLQNNFRRQDYAIALPQYSSLKEDLDQSLLKHLESPNWQQQLSRYLGLANTF